MAPADPAYFVYIVECADGSLYTGIAKDVEARVALHNEGRGARYTRGRGPVLLLTSAGPLAWGDALRLERDIKRVPRDRKLAELETFSGRRVGSRS